MGAPPGLFPFSRALPAAFCPLNGRGAKPDGWMERWEMTSEPPLFAARFPCPLLAVCRYERSAGSAPMFFWERGEAGQSWQLRCRGALCSQRIVPLGSTGVSPTESLASAADSREAARRLLALVRRKGRAFKGVLCAGLWGSHSSLARLCRCKA